MLTLVEVIACRNKLRRGSGLRMMRHATQQEVDQLLDELYGDAPIPSRAEVAIRYGCPRINHDKWYEDTCKK